MIDEDIFITCPVTAVPVSTGFRAPRGTNIRGLRGASLRRCPACQKEHLWDGADGYWNKEPQEWSLWEGFLNIWKRLKRA